MPEPTFVALVCPSHGTPKWAPVVDHNEQIRRCDTVGCRRPLEEVRAAPYPGDDLKRALREVIAAYDATVRLEPGAEDRLVTAICDGRAALREAPSAPQGIRVVLHPSLHLHPSLRAMPAWDGMGCPQCNGDVVPRDGLGHERACVDCGWRL